MTLQTRTRSQRGVSLIEALVALAVMAFGMLGYVGMQSTLRTNADLSRQRAEAVRLAQEEVERVRNYSVLRTAEAVGDQLAFDAIDSVARDELAASAANTTFFRETIVATPSVVDPLVRHVRVRVEWADRRASDPNQSVELSSLVSGFPLEVSGLQAMRTDRGPMQQPLGRHSAVPRGAVDAGDGTSSFTPPGGSPDLRWIFNNTTGLITQVCNPPGTCTATNRWLLSGIVAFATGDAPTSSEAAAPADAAFALSMRVRVLIPAATPDEVCATQLLSTRINYYCAVPTDDASIWTGTMLFSGFPLSTTLSDASATRYKVCRYTPDDRNLLRNPTTPPPAESELYYNSRHPFRYWRVNGPQINKNFLVISAGDGSAAYSCPDEDTATLIETNTWPHDPRT